MTYLESKEDLDWLKEVHGVDIHTESMRRAKCAILHGNEDCPDKVELFLGGKHNAPFRIYEHNSLTNKLQKVFM